MPSRAGDEVKVIQVFLVLLFLFLVFLVIIFLLPIFILVFLGTFTFGTGLLVLTSSKPRMQIFDGVSLISFG